MRSLTLVACLAVLTVITACNMGGRGGPDPVVPRPEFYSGARLLGASVRCMDGEVGALSDVVLALDGTAVAYTVELEQHQRAFVVPPSAMRGIRATSRQIALDLQSDAMLAAPDVERGMEISSLALAMRSHYGNEAAPFDDVTGEAYLLAEVLGSSVREVGFGGERIGDIHDVILDMRNGSVTLASVDTDGLGSAQRALPWGLVQMARNGDFHFRVSSELLRTAPAMVGGALLQDAWLAQVEDHYKSPAH